MIEHNATIVARCLAQCYDKCLSIMLQSIDLVVLTIFVWVEWWPPLDLSRDTTQSETKLEFALPRTSE